MTRTGRVGHALRIVLTALVLGMGLLATTLTVAIPAAEAHAELREASPGVGQTVGGEFHRIAMHFTGLDATQPQAMQLFDPAGNLIDEGGAAEGQRLVLSISPLTLPGEYTVNYQVNGIDGDYVEESYTFRYEPSADEPSELTIGNPIDEGFDWVTFALLLAGSATAAFLVHRFFTALRDHRAAQASFDEGDPAELADQNESDLLADVDGP